MNRPPLQLIWDSSDAIATAQRFHAELAHAEHGTRYCLRCDRSAYVVAIGPDGICASCRRTSTPVSLNVKAQRNSVIGCCSAGPASVAHGSTTAWPSPYSWRSWPAWV